MTDIEILRLIVMILIGLLSFVLIFLFAMMKRLGIKSLFNFKKWIKIPYIKLDGDYRTKKELDKMNQLIVDNYNCSSIDKLLLLKSIVGNSFRFSGVVSGNKLVIEGLEITTDDREKKMLKEMTG